MDTEEIDYKDNNRLLAEFLDWKLNSIGVYGYFRQFDKTLFNPLTGNERSFDPETLAFHCSWSWLMPIVEKIEKMGFTVYIYANHCKIWHPDDMDRKLAPIAWGWSGNVEDSEKILGTYFAVVDFIKWYKTQNHENQENTTEERTEGN